VAVDLGVALVVVAVSVAVAPGAVGRHTTGHSCSSYLEKFISVSIRAREQRNG
jgi:hypothetical protein